MTRNEKAATIEELKEKLAEHEFFYVTDSSSMTVAQVNDLRRKCFENDIEMRVVKNTLVIKAIEAAAEEKGYAPLVEALKGPSAFMFTKTANAPAKLLQEFRKSSDKPILKAAYIDTDVFIGDDKIEVLSNLKSKEDLIADVILLLGSPVRNVIGALQGGGPQTITGLLKALEERAANS